jgi:hypothetical protein
MANSVDLVIGSEAIKQVENLIAKLSLADSELLKVSQSALTASKNITSIGTPTALDASVKNTAALNSELDKQSKSIANLNAQIVSLKSQQQQQAQTQIASTRNANNQTTANRNQAVSNQILRAETDRNFRATTNLGGAYAKLSAQVLVLKKEAKDLAVVFGEDSIQARNATKAALDMDTRIKEVDKSVGDSQRKVGDYGSAFTHGMGKAWGAVRKLAYILPGVGIAGIFAFALDPIIDYVKSLDFVKKMMAEVVTAKTVLNRAFSETSVQDATKNVNELTINIGLAKDGFLDKKKVVEQYNETIGKTTGLVTNLDEAEKGLVKNGDAYIKMMLYKAAANLALEDAAKQSLEAEKSRQKDLKEFASNLQDATPQIRSQEQYEAYQKVINKNQKERKANEVKTNADASQKNISIAKKFQDDAAKIAKDFNFNLFGDNKAEKVDKKAAKEKLKLTEESLKADYEAKLSNLKFTKEAISDELKLKNKSIDEQINLSLKLAKAEIEIAETVQKEKLRLSKNEYKSNPNIKSGTLETPINNDFNTEKANAISESATRVSKIYSDFFKESSKDIKEGEEAWDAFIKGHKLTPEQEEILNEYNKKIKEKLEETKNYFKSFISDFASNSGFGETLRLFDDEFKFLERSAKEKTVAIMEAFQEMGNFIQNQSQQRFEGEKQRLQDQYDLSVGFAGDSAVAKEKLAKDLEKKQKEIANRENKAKQKQAMFNIAIDTAQAVIATLAKTPAPAGLPFAIAVGVLGAIQLAMVASQKVPQYKGGTQNHSGGLMLVNDGSGSNFQEKVITPDGKELIPEGRNVLLNAPKGTKVLNHEQQIHEMLNERGISMSRSNFSNGMTANEMDSIMDKHFSKIETNVTNFDRNGFSSYTERNGNRTINHNNRVSRTGFKV